MSNIGKPIMMIISYYYRKLYTELLKTTHTSYYSFLQPKLQGEAFITSKKGYVIGQYVLK